MRVPDYSNEVAGNQRALPNSGAKKADRVTPPSEGDQSARRNAGEPSSSVDAVEISPFSQALLKEAEASSKVEALQKQYEQGTYAVDPEQLAKSLIESHLVEREAPPPRAEGKPAAAKRAEKSAGTAT